MEIPHTVLILALVVFGFLFGLLEAPGLPSSLVVIPLGSDGGVIVCAIVFRNATRGIECSTISSVGKVGETFPLHPSINYSSLSVGHGSLCGLEFDGTSFYCWKLTNNGSSNGTRVYHNGTVPLRDLVVGESQVAASDLNGTFIQWWLAGRDFPTKLLGSFHSHTSGAGFTCAIDGSNDAAMCWGPRSQQIQATFADQRMSTIVAGRYGACGVTKEGRLLCSSSGSNFRQLSFEFGSLSLGSNHTCVIRSLNRTLVCWGAGGDDYFPAESSSFIFLVANDNLFCGLTDMSYDIHCWRTDRSP